MDLDQYINKNEIDIAVIGGGPSGNITAINLVRNGYSVILLENKSKTNIAGETLSPKTNYLLHKLGLGHLLSNDVLFNTQIIHNWTSQIRKINYDLHPYGKWISIDKEKFNEKLLEEAAKQGVMVFQKSKLQSIVEVPDSQKNFQLKVTNEETTYDFSCKFIVDATGRSSFISRLFGSKRKFFDKLVAIVGILDIKHNDDVITVKDNSILIEPFDMGWWFSVFISNNKIVATVFTDSDLFPNTSHLRRSVWLALLLRSKLTKKRIRDYRLNSIYLVSANSSIISPMYGNKWISVGDANCTFDPLSSNGISHAIESAFLASKNIAKKLSNCGGSLYEYEKTLKNKFERYLNEQMIYYNLEQRWNNSIFWSRRQK